MTRIVTQPGPGIGEATYHVLKDASSLGPGHGFGASARLAAMNGGREKEIGRFIQGNKKAEQEIKEHQESRDRMRAFQSSFDMTAFRHLG